MEEMSMHKTRFFFLTVIVFGVFSPLLFAEDDSRWLVPRNLVATTDLKIVWQFNLPLSDTETLDHLYVFGNRLCALSSRNYLNCLNRADGNVLFANFIASSGLPVAGLGAYKGGLLTMVGDKLIAINAESGVEETSTRIIGGVTCPVVRNDSFFYIAGADKRLRALRVNDKVKVFEAAAENDSLITSVLADREFVIFATNAGNVIYMAPDKPAKLWQFDAPGAVVGDVVRDANSLYFACRDTNIYRLELTSGHLIWKHQIQAIPKTTPQLGKKVVYQYLPDTGLDALDKETSKLLWQQPDCLGLLAESGDKAFIISKSGTLIVMDNVKAKKLYSVDIGQPVQYATNANDSKIYIGDAKGRLACLQPVQ
jgi:outer membrane protein assembly factor BamB